MALDQIRLGTPPSGQDGDDARTAFSRINANFKSMDDWAITGPVNRTVTNLNDAVAPGWYAALSGSAANIPPGITYPLVQVTTHPNGFILQEARDVITGKPAWRSYNANVSGWGAWRPGLSTLDVGTAASGVLTTSNYDDTAGRVLKVGDFGLGRNLVATETNLNSYLAPGSYVTPASGLTNLPPTWAQGRAVLTVVGGASYALQSIARNGLTASRWWNGTTWESWVLNYNEKGANTNGRYTKFSDGTQICEGYVQLPAQALSTAVGVTGTFASPFSSTPRVVFCPLAAVGTGSQADVGATLQNGPYAIVSAASWSLNSYAYRNATSFPVQFNYIAFGRWFE
ncbi:pyocin knob domain-containing protein [Pseudomonas sp. NBRC 111124]|uniref:pyocin knob domain-containing protein n=1 Tax=Pseudomonas sp. NBRC 111124 TaxID=1661039 RepID=UPI000760CA67|nr:pyocin knob domain-containing protein [Pseudomonas sp. NBRC 111124]